MANPNAEEGTEPVLSKQYVARHDKAMRTVIQTFIERHRGSYYLIADVGN